MLQWDGHDRHLFLFGSDKVWHTENVITNYHRFPDPAAAVAAHMRDLLELDRPHPAPRAELRVWAVAHTPATMITAARLERIEPTARYERRAGVLQLAAGTDLLEAAHLAVPAVL